MSTTEVESVLMTKSQVAAHIKMTPRSIDRKIREGTFPAPHVRLGSAPRWIRKQLLLWIEQGCQPPGAANDGEL